MYDSYHALMALKREFKWEQKCKNYQGAKLTRRKSYWVYSIGIWYWGKKGRCTPLTPKHLAFLQCYHTFNLELPPAYTYDLNVQNIHIIFKSGFFLKYKNLLI